MSASDEIKYERQPANGYKRVRTATHPFIHFSSESSLVQASPSESKPVQPLFTKKPLGLQDLLRTLRNTHEGSGRVRSSTVACGRQKFSPFRVSKATLRHGLVRKLRNACEHFPKAFVIRASSFDIRLALSPAKRMEFAAWKKLIDR